jgi:hypothetical protein
VVESLGPDLPPTEVARKDVLQGRAVCGRCGRHFRVRYTARRGKLESWYICDRANSGRGEPNCQSIAGGPVDEAIGSLVVEKMTPTAVELTLSGAHAWARAEALLSQKIEQRSCGFQICRLEPFREPVIDWLKQRERLFAPILIAPQPREAHGCA